MRQDHAVLFVGAADVSNVGKVVFQRKNIVISTDQNDATVQTLQKLEAGTLHNDITKMDHGVTLVNLFIPGVDHHFVTFFGRACPWPDQVTVVIFEPIDLVMCKMMVRRQVTVRH